VALFLSSRMQTDFKPFIQLTATLVLSQICRLQPLSACVNLGHASS
jgi:hypothetical protein